jgi:hypothetical protein
MAAMVRADCHLPEEVYRRDAIEWFSVFSASVMPK